MKSLKTNYLGLELASPLVMASCGLTNSVESIKRIADKGIGAIVLKSLFEEQIMVEANANFAINEYDYPESADYIKNYSKANSLNTYLKLISDSKKAVNVPIIASVNCVTSNEWTSFAKDIENAGADAIELNVSLLPSNPNISAVENEKIYIDIIESVSKKVKIPLSLKISNSSSGLSALLHKIDWSGYIKGLVLFNRHYCPDIDIVTLKTTTAPVFSHQADYAETLRWISLISNDLKCDVSATTGIHDGNTLIKMLLAGATTVQIASVVYKKGVAVIAEMLNDLEKWMDEKNYKGINDFRGKLSVSKIEHPEVFERVQFMKYFSSIE